MMEPTQPKAAASVGVATPSTMTPITMNTTNESGTTWRMTPMSFSRALTCLTS